MKKLVAGAAAIALALGSLWAFVLADDDDSFVRYDAQGNEIERREFRIGDPIFACWTDSGEPCEEPEACLTLPDGTKVCDFE